MAKQAATLVGLSLLIDSVVGRPGYLASPIALNKSTFFTEIDPSVIISADWDAVNVVWDSYGVPWSSFLNNAPQPEWWQERLNRTIAATQAWKLPVVLTLPGGAGQNRGCPAENASESGSSYPSVSGTIVCDNDCFDYNTVTNPLASFFRQGYVNFVLYMISAFVPVNVNYAIDANRVLEKCPSEFASYVDFMNQVYDTIKVGELELVSRHSYTASHNKCSRATALASSTFLLRANCKCSPSTLRWSRTHLFRWSRSWGHFLVSHAPGRLLSQEQRRHSHSFRASPVAITLQVA